MEPALPPIHPQVPELLKSLGLQIIEPLKWNVLLCRRSEAAKDGPLLILKFGSDPRKAASIKYEVRIIRDVLPQFDEQYFERLVIPEYVSDGHFGELDWVLTKYIKGEPLLFEWSEKTYKSDILGGKRIGVHVAKYAVDVLRDLRLVDMESIPDFVRRFDFGQWLEQFRVQSQELVDLRIWSQETVGRALELFQSLGTDRYQGNMFTNGDFYPRNFILLPKGRIAVADWVGGVDPWEFVAMKAWIMMWGNPAWQIAFVKDVKKHFPVDVDEMQVGILVKSHDQIYAWREKSEDAIGIARSQLLSYFTNSLDNNFVQQIFA